MECEEARGGVDWLGGFLSTAMGGHLLRRLYCTKVKCGITSRQPSSTRGVDGMDSKKGADINWQEGKQEAKKEKKEEASTARARPPSEPNGRATFQLSGV